MAFNSHMARIFVSRRVVCLDESMSIWLNQRTCPGWVYCQRKPHPCENEYHTACCVESGILFSIKIVEGKGRPQEIQAQEFARSSKPARLMMQLLT